MARGTAKKLAAVGLLLSVLVGSHHLISRDLQQKLRVSDARFKQLNYALRQRRDLPVVSPNPLMDRENLKISYFHSSDAYKDWLRVESRRLNTGQMELHAAVTQTVRNMQDYSKTHVEKPERAEFPVTIFSDEDRLFDHAILLAEELATSKNVYEPLEERFKKRQMAEKMLLRPDYYAPVFRGPYRIPFRGITYGVVNAISQKRITDGFGKVLRTGKIGEAPIELVGHEAIHAFDGQKSEDEVIDLSGRLERSMLENPKIARKIFAPLLALRERQKPRIALKMQREPKTLIKETATKTRVKYVPGLPRRPVY